jgi:hypothetical protein
LTLSNGLTVVLSAISRNEAPGCSFSWSF